MEIDTPSNVEFDLEGFAAGYTGAARLEHLMFVASQKKGQPLELEALRLAADQLAEGNNMQLYQDVMGRINGRLGPNYVLDRALVKQKEQEATERHAALDAELAVARTSQVKDDVRRAYMALGDAWVGRGAANDALKCYMRARDYCTTAEHVLEIVIKCAIELRQWVHVSAYRKKAETLAGTMADVQVSSQLAAAGGLYALSQGKFEEAARHYAEVSPDLGSDFSDVLSAQDIAMHGALCALASLDRPVLQMLVVDSPGFREHLESTPQMRDAVHAFYASRFAESLALLETLRPTLGLSPHLAPHLAALLREVRRRALELYSRPYRVVSLEAMATALGMPRPELEAGLEALIGEGRVVARIDGAAGRLQAARHDPGAAALEAVLAAGEEFVAASRALALRASMMQHDLIQRGAVGTLAGPRGEAQRLARLRDRTPSQMA